MPARARAFFHALPAAFRIGWPLKVNAISLFALLAVVGVALGYRRHHTLAPLVIAVISLAVILWVMFGSYNRIIELIGFTGLIIAATWDWRLKRREPTSTPVPE